jgi:hypothetical protein
MRSRTDFVFEFMSDRPTGRFAIAVLYESDDVGTGNDSINEAHVAHRTKGTAAWIPRPCGTFELLATSRVEICFVQETSPVIDGEYVNAILTNTIDDPVVSLNDLTQLLTPEFGNDLAGIRKLAKTFS